MGYKHLQLALGKWRRLRRDFGLLQSCCTPVMWNPNASLPEALETLSASLSEGAAGELQYSSFSLANFMYIIAAVKKALPFLPPCPERKGRRATLVRIFKRCAWSLQSLPGEISLSSGYTWPLGCQPRFSELHLEWRNTGKTNLPFPCREQRVIKRAFISTCSTFIDFLLLLSEVLDLGGIFF